VSSTGSKITKWVVLIALVLGAYAAYPAILDRVHETQASMALSGMTPNALLGTCGGPAKLWTQKIGEDTFSQELTYKGPSATVVIKFTGTPDGHGNYLWKRTAFEDPEGKVTYDTDRSKVEALPCLAE
jgi:hypothetical protein